MVMVYRKRKWELVAGSTKNGWARRVAVHRTFDGRRYKLYEYYKEKAQADRAMRNIQMGGYLARMVKTHGHYFVYEGGERKRNTAHYWE